MIHYVINFSPESDSAGTGTEPENRAKTPDNPDPAIGSGDMTALVNGEQANTIGDESGAGAGAGVGNTTNPQTKNSTIGDITKGGSQDISKTNIGNGEAAPDSANAMINNTGLDSPEASGEEDTDLSTGSLDADAATG